MKRRLLYIFAAAFVVYLLGSALVACHEDYEYKEELLSHLRSLGNDYFPQTDKLRLDLANDPKLQSLRGILRCDLPFGWIGLQRVDFADEEALYASKNIALPLSQRFADTREALRLGFDPARRDNASILDELTKNLR